MHLVLRTEPFIRRTWQPHMEIVNSLFLQIAFFSLVLLYQTDRRFGSINTDHILGPKSNTSQNPQP